MSGTKPLAGLKVVEWTTFVAAPVCGRMLADWGADVIKVETPDGDYWRTYGPKMNVPASDDENPLFDIPNANKRSITLDLRSVGGREIMERLVAQADVMITNTRVRVLKKLKLDYDSVKERYPGLVYAQITGYGDYGPESHRPGYDAVTYWAYGGFMADMKVDEPGSKPINVPAAVADIGAGSMLFGAVMAALYSKKNTGRGDKVSVSLFGEAAWTLGVMATVAQPGYDYKYPMSRDEVKPTSTSFLCADGEYIVVAAVQYDRDFPRLCSALGLPDVAAQPGYKDFDTMMLDENRIPLMHIFEKQFLTKTSLEWDQLFEAADIVHDRQIHFRDVTSNEQARANHFFEEVTFRNGNKAWLPRPCIVSDNLGVPDYKLGPVMGQDSENIVNELGFSAAEVDRLRSDEAFLGANHKARIR